jgi:hypothetical protein
MARIVVLAVSFLFVVNSHAQEEKLKPLLKTDWAIHNLKGEVEEIKVQIERFYSEDLPVEIKTEYDIRNYFESRGLPMGY